MIDPIIIGLSFRALLKVTVKLLHMKELCCFQQNLVNVDNSPYLCRALWNITKDLNRVVLRGANFSSYLLVFIC